MHSHQTYDDVSNNMVDDGEIISVSRDSAQTPAYKEG